MMNKDKFSPYQQLAIEHWKRYLDSCTDEFESNLREIIFCIKNGTILEKGCEKEICKIEFWHDAWEFDFSLVLLDDKEMHLEHKFKNKLLFTKYQQFKELLKFDFLYPETFDVYYEENREEILEKERFSCFFEWFSNSWMKCNGHKLNILATTEENSVRRIFNLNHFNWDENVEYLYPKQNQMVQPSVNRKLSDLEMRKRIEFDSLPEFKTCWRFLVKKTEFVEYGVYNNLLYKRKGDIADFDLLGFESTKFDRVKVCNEIDKFLNVGYSEINRPYNGPKVEKDIIDLSISNDSEESKRSVEKLEQIETELKMFLPGSYKFFLSTVLNENRTTILNSFPVSHENWRKVELYNGIDEIIESLKRLSKNQSKMLPIARTTKSEQIFLEIDTGMIKLISNSNEYDLGNGFEEFLLKCTNVSECFCPKRYHIEKGNLTTVKSWIDAGWDMKDVMVLGGSSVLQISYNDEMNMLLLENGADPNEPYLYGDIISREYLEFLIEKGLDLKRKLKEQDWLKKELLNRKIFDDLIVNYE